MFSLVAPPGGSTEDQISATDGKLWPDLQAIFDPFKSIKVNVARNLRWKFAWRTENREKRGGRRDERGEKKDKELIRLEREAP